jgi:hypothetical protein
MLPKVLAASVTVNDTDSSIADIISGMIDYILPFIGGILMLMIIYGGVLYITSGGDPDKLQKAKRTILWAVVAVILIAISYSIVVALNKVVNTEILN